MTARRIGHLYPSGGISEHEIQRMAPEGLHFLTTRMPFRRTGREDDLGLLRDVETHAALLADARVELIAFNCTAASLMAGPGVVEARIERATGVPAVTTIDAVMQALGRLGVRRVALFTPYPPEVVEEEIRYLDRHGITVVAQRHLPCATPVEQGTIPPDRWRDLARNTDLAGAEALLFSCAGIGISPMIAAIEAAAGLPVVTSNSALLRLVMDRLEWPDPVSGYGRLLGA